MDRPLAVLLGALNALVPLVYLGLAAGYAVTFFLRRRTVGRSPELLLVLLAHGLLVGLRGWAWGRVPLATSAEVASGLALAMTAVYAGLEALTRDRRTGLFVLGAAFLLQYTSSLALAGAAAADTGAAEQGWGQVHVLPALLAYVAAGFAGLYGTLYLGMRRELRGHRFGMLFDRLPPLEPLGRLTRHAMVTGFVLLTVTIAAGPLLTGQAAAMSPKLLVKIVVGSAAWLVYAAALAGRWLGRWRTARLAKLAVAGLVLMLVVLVASGVLP